MKNKLLEILFYLIVSIAFLLSVFFFSSDSAFSSVSNASNSLNQKRTDSLIYIASLYIGEYEINENSSKNIDYWLKKVNINKPYPWCAAFASHCLDSAGIDNPRNPWVDAWRYGKWKFKLIPKIGTYKSNQIKTGDIFLIWSNLYKRYNHLGIVYQVNENFIETIEGNTNEKGSVNGCCVLNRKRNLNQIGLILRLIN